MRKAASILRDPYGAPVFLARASGRVRYRLPPIEIDPVESQIWEEPPEIKHGNFSHPETFDGGIHGKIIHGQCLIAKLLESWNILPLAWHCGVVYEGKLKEVIMKLLGKSNRWNHSFK